jgi:metal-responsive CopG/Arc/MetJ family transcriptional regulator
MSVRIALPDDLAAEIDEVTTDRSAFVEEAVRRLLTSSAFSSAHDEVAKINAVADELNREAEDSLEYQVFP